MNVNVEYSSSSLLLSVWPILTDYLSIWLISHREFPFFNYPSLPNATQPDYSIIDLIIFLRFPLYGFYSGEKITDKNFWSVLILTGYNHWSVKNIGHH